MAKDPCEICREQVILELFARIGGRTLVQKDCKYCNVRMERKDGEYNDDVSKHREGVYGTTQDG